MNFRRIKMFLKFHWIKILIVALIFLVTVSLIVLVKLGMDAWGTLESFYKQTQMAALPLQLYLYIVGGMIMACVYVFLWYWMMFRGGGFQQATQIKKKAVAGEEVGVKWDDIIGMEETKQEAFEVVKLISDRAQLKRLGGKILRDIRRVDGVSRQHPALHGLDVAWRRPQFRRGSSKKVWSATGWRSTHWSPNTAIICRCTARA